MVAGSSRRRSLRRNGAAPLLPLAALHWGLPLGGSGEVRQLHEAGKLRLLLEGAVGQVQGRLPDEPSSVAPARLCSLPRLREIRQDLRRGGRRHRRCELRRLGLAPPSMVRRCSVPSRFFFLIWLTVLSSWSPLNQIQLVY
jgi:hypothetical protein